jgi:hypothetical protein
MCQSRGVHDPRAWTLMMGSKIDATRLSRTSPPPHHPIPPLCRESSQGMVWSLDPLTAGMYAPSPVRRERGVRGDRRRDDALCGLYPISPRGRGKNIPTPVSSARGGKGRTASHLEMNERSLGCSRFERVGRHTSLRPLGVVPASDRRRCAGRRSTKLTALTGWPRHRPAGRGGWPRGSDPLVP